MYPLAAAFGDSFFYCFFAGEASESSGGKIRTEVKVEKDHMVFVAGKFPIFASGSIAVFFLENLVGSGCECSRQPRSV